MFLKIHIEKKDWKDLHENGNSIAFGDKKYRCISFPLCYINVFCKIL